MSYTCTWCLNSLPYSVVTCTGSLLPQPLIRQLLHTLSQILEIGILSRNVNPCLGLCLLKRAILFEIYLVKDRKLYSDSGNYLKGLCLEMDIF
jgi:hypothetical protein